MATPIKVTFLTVSSVARVNLHGSTVSHTPDNSLIIVSLGRVTITGLMVAVIREKSRTDSDTELENIQSMRQPTKVTGLTAKNKAKEKSYSRVEVYLRVISKTI